MPAEHKAKYGTWHQATNSLKLVLCKRDDKQCREQEAQRSVFVSLIHRKFPNYLSLPLRYERHFIVWSASPPFSMLGISQHPILFANETAMGWTAQENWDDPDPAMRERNYGKGYWAYFTYTTSMSYAWGRDKDEAPAKNVGYLDDEVILGVGVDDWSQTYVKAKAGDLVQCMKACPGRGK